MEAVSFGISKLDDILSKKVGIKGLIKGYTLLVKGQTGSGQELFAKQFAGIPNNLSEHVLYVTTNENEKEVRAFMAKYNWNSRIDILDIKTRYYEKVLDPMFEMSQKRREGFGVADLLGLGQESQEKDRDINFLSDVEVEALKLKNPFRLVIDSFDFFLEHYKDDSVAKVRAIQDYVYKNNSVAMITMASGVTDANIEKRIENIVDGVIEMDYRQIGNIYDNTMYIKKMRNYPQLKLLLKFSVTDKGITPEVVERIS